MKEIEILKHLLDLNGPGVPRYILARYCHCTGVSIQNYISGKSLPSGSKLQGIKEGLRTYKELINRIIKE